MSVRNKNNSHETNRVDRKGNAAFTGRIVFVQEGVRRAARPKELRSTLHQVVAVIDFKNPVFDQMGHGDDPTRHISDRRKTHPPSSEVEQVSYVGVLVHQGYGEETGLLFC